MVSMSTTNAVKTASILKIHIAGSDDFPPMVALVSPDGSTWGKNYKKNYYDAEKNEGP